MIINPVLSSFQVQRGGMDQKNQVCILLEQVCSSSANAKWVKLIAMHRWCVHHQPKNIGNKINQINLNDDLLQEWV